MTIEMIESRGVRLTFIPRGTRAYSRGALRRDADFLADTLIVSERDRIDGSLEDLASKYGRPVEVVERALIRMLHTTRIHRRVLSHDVRNALLK